MNFIPPGGFHPDSHPYIHVDYRQLTNYWLVEFEYYMDSNCQFTSVIQGSEGEIYFLVLVYNKKNMIENIIILF